MKKPKPTKLCFNIPIKNATASPVEYVLFADSRQVAQIPLPNWSALKTEMEALRDRHTDMEGYFRLLQVENDAAVAGLRQADFQQFDDVQVAMQLSATAFDNLANALSVQAQSAQVSELQQFSREVALAPILVNEITLTTNTPAQLQQTYQYDKSLVRRAGKDIFLDFFQKYNPLLKNNKVTLTEKDLGGTLRFDGTTGFRFTLLPNTQITLQFCYAFAPPLVCCTPQAQPKEKPTPNLPKPTPTKPLPTATAQTPKAKQAQEPTMVPTPKQKTNVWWYGLALGILLLILGVLAWWQARK